MYDDVSFLTVPGRFAGLPSLRFEDEDAHEERASFAYLRFTDPATLWVAFDAAKSAGWLTDWRKTGHTIGTTDHTRTVYRKRVGSGTTVLGDAGDSGRMYTVFYRQR